MSQAPVLFVSHGGGPLPLLGHTGHRALVESLRQLAVRLPRPEAILVISAHWEEEVATLQAAAHPPLLYDYSGFEAAAYGLRYPAPGSPPLALHIADLLEAHAIPHRLDPQRGYDHGAFVPLLLLFPEATIPTLQLSLVRGLDPRSHLQLGRALRELRQDNILILGSGFTFHNLPAFARSAPGGDPANDAFQEWLIETLTSPLAAAERQGRLMAWEQAPHARYCHPREEHLLPLHVCQGAAGGPATVILDAPILGKRALAFHW
jgi:4,5-DOPA dioxygenase extradiol